MIRNKDEKTKKEEMHFSPEEITIKLKKIIKMIEKIHSDWGNEITPAQARIIFPIVRDGKGYTMQELTNMVGVTKGLVSRTVTHLESKGLVERDKTTESRNRNYKIVLSTKGQELLIKKMSEFKNFSSKLKGKITHRDILIFNKVLDALIETQIAK